MRTKKTMSMFEIYIRFQPIGSAAFFQVSKKKYNQRSAAVVFGGLRTLHAFVFVFSRPCWSSFPGYYNIWRHADPPFD